MAQRISGLLVKLSADSAELKRELAAMKRQMRSFGNRATRESNRVKYAFNKLRRAAQVVASAFIFTAGVRAIGRLAVSIEHAEDRMKLMTARFQQFGREEDTFLKVYKLAQKLGISIDEAATGLTRLLVATRSLGTEQEKLLQIQENIVLLGRAGGTSTEEMVGGMRQLTQGLASGRLQGEELRSVLENLPLVAMEIAKEMGITIGQIRRFAAEGKITGDVVVRALENVEIKAEDLPDTFGMAAQRISTEWDLLLAALGKSLNTSGFMEDIRDFIRAARIRWDPLSDMSSDMLLNEFEHANLKVRVLQEAIKERTYDRPGSMLHGEPMTPGTLMWERAQGRIDANPFIGDTDAFLRSASALNDELAEELEYIKEIKAALKTREFNDAVDEIRDALKEPLTDLEVSQIIAGHDPFGGKKVFNKDAFNESMKDFDEFIAGVEKGEKDLATSVARIKDQISTDVDDFIAKMKVARVALALGPEDGISQEEFDSYREMLLEDIAPALDDLDDKTRKTFRSMEYFAQQAARNIQNSFAEFFFDPFSDGLSGMVKDFIDAIRTMLANQLALQFFDMIGMQGILDSIAGKATGGPVDANTPYIVGERGPELMVPRQSGTIVPNHKLDKSVVSAEVPNLGKNIPNIVNDGSDITNISMISKITESLRNVFNNVIQNIKTISTTNFSVDGLVPDMDDAIFSTFGAMFGGARALGGPVSAGTPYLVGERGPEIMVPNASGVVIPNNEIQASGGNVINNYSFEAGADVATIRAEIIPMLERTQQSTLAEIHKRKERGRL